MRDEGAASSPTSPPSQTRDGGTTVGYKRPPKHHQFKKGHSGNRKGRPRGTKNLTALLTDILEENVGVSVSGQATRMTLKEALVSSALNRALKGDKAATDFILLLAEKTGRLDEVSVGHEPGIAVFPERSATYAEWEAKHGAAARGDKYLCNNSEPPCRPKTSTVEAGDELFRAGNLIEAFATYRRALSLRKRPLEKCETPEERERLTEIVCRIMRVGQALLLRGRYQEALNVAVIGEAAAPQEPWVYAVRFYALILLGHSEEARILLDQFKGQMWTSDSYSEDYSHKLPWEVGLIEGFWLVRDAGINDPLLDEIENSHARK